jgi:transposase
MKAFFRRARKGEKPGFPRVRPHRNFFYASFVHDVEEETHAHDGVLAIDVGVKTLATGVNEQGRFYHIGGFKGGSLLQQASEPGSLQ